jgi:nucleoid-associated protein Lsr2
MAQKVVVSLVDDLAGGTAEETVAFGLDGRDYEIDLSSANASKLREAVATFVAAARPTRR